MEDVELVKLTLGYGPLVKLQDNRVGFCVAIFFIARFQNEAFHPPS